MQGKSTEHIPFVPSKRYGLHLSRGAVEPATPLELPPRPIGILFDITELQSVAGAKLSTLSRNLAGTLPCSLRGYTPKVVHHIHMILTSDIVPPLAGSVPSSTSYFEALQKEWTSWWLSAVRETMDWGWLGVQTDSTIPTSTNIGSRSTPLRQQVHRNRSSRLKSPVISQIRAPSPTSSRPSTSSQSAGAHRALIVGSATSPPPRRRCLGVDVSRAFGIQSFEGSSLGYGCLPASSAEPSEVILDITTLEFVEVLVSSLLQAANGRRGVSSTYIGLRLEDVSLDMMLMWLSERLQATNSSVLAFDDAFAMDVADVGKTARKASGVGSHCGPPPNENNNVQLLDHPSNPAGPVRAEEASAHISSSRQSESSLSAEEADCLDSDSDDTTAGNGADACFDDVLSNDGDYSSVNDADGFDEEEHSEERYAEDPSNTKSTGRVVKAPSSSSSSSSPPSVIGDSDDDEFPVAHSSGLGDSLPRSFSADGGKDQLHRQSPIPMPHDHRGSGAGNVVGVRSTIGTESSPVREFSPHGSVIPTNINASDAWQIFANSSSPEAVPHLSSIFATPSPPRPFEVNLLDKRRHSVGSYYPNEAVMSTTAITHPPGEGGISSLVFRSELRLPARTALRRGHHPTQNSEMSETVAVEKFDRTDNAVRTVVVGDQWGDWLRGSSPSVRRPRSPTIPSLINFVSTPASNTKRRTVVTKRAIATPFTASSASSTNASMVDVIDPEVSRITTDMFNRAKKSVSPLRKY